MKKIWAAVVIATGLMSGCAVYPAVPGGVVVQGGGYYAGPAYRPVHPAYGYGYHRGWGYRRW